MKLLLQINSKIADAFQQVGQTDQQEQIERPDLFSTFLSDFPRNSVVMYEHVNTPATQHEPDDDSKAYHSKIHNTEISSGIRRDRKKMT